MAFSPDGKILASGGYDQTIKLWDVATGKCTATIEDPKGGTSRVAFSPDGKTLAWPGGGKAIKLWDVTTGKNVDSLEGHTNTVLCITFSPNGKMLASTSSDMATKLWDLRKGLTTVALPASGRQVVFSPDGKTLALGTGRIDKATNKGVGEVKLWDVASGKNTATFEEHANGVLSLAFSPDGKTLATASLDRSVKLWDVATGKDVATFTMEHILGIADLTCVAFSPDGETVVVAGSQGHVDGWNVDTHKHVFSHRLHPFQVNSVAFSLDGKTLATASMDKTIKLWGWPLPPK